MRRRFIEAKEKPLEVVKELDAFPKVPESFKETSVSGGGVSILTFVLIGILVVTEFQYYRTTELKYDYEVDADFDQKILINVDLTVAMPCEQIGADVVDMTGQNAHSFGHLNEEPAYFELTPHQKSYLDTVQRVNDYIRREYMAMHEILWKTGYGGMSGMPARDVQPETDPDACRIHGTLEVNKVAGNFHVTAGKHIQLPFGHAHAAFMLSQKDYNFTHRIDHFSFGPVTPGVVNPLDGDEKFTENNYHMFQYFINIVPTKVDTSKAKIDTFQFSVSEKNRSIDHSKGSHGVPGIFMKYDINSLKIKVVETNPPLLQFIIRLCGIVGGVFATTGMIHSLIGALFDVLCCRYKIKFFDKILIPTHSTSSSASLDSTASSSELSSGPSMTPSNLSPSVTSASNITLLSDSGSVS